MLLEIFAAWMLADFISGLVHWWEDRAMVGQSRFKFLNGVRSDNERHHNMPGYLVRLSWWDNISTTAPLAWVLALILALVGAPLLAILTAFFLGFGNLVHRWSHEPIGKLPRPIYWLQKTGLLISASHHSGHHFKGGKLVSREDSQIRFCVMTNWLNPILDGLRFFKFLEYILVRKSVD